MPNVVDKAITDLESAQIIQDEDLFVVEQDDTAKSVSGALIKQYASVSAIETVKVNDTALTPDADRAVNVIVPTKTSDLTNDSHFPSDASYVHTDNNYTTGEKTKLSGIETGAEVNSIETVKVNGTALTPDADRAVNIVVSVDPDAEIKHIAETAFVQRVSAGEIAAFDDGADHVPVADLTVELPYKSAGYTGCTVTHSGKNLLNETAFQTYSNWSNLYPDATGQGATTNSALGFALPPFTPGNNYTVSFALTGNTVPTYLYLCAYTPDDNEAEVIVAFTGEGTGTGLYYTEYTFTAAVNKRYYLRMTSATAELFAENISCIAWIQVEVGASKTTYTPHTEQTYQSDWTGLSGTIYGGTWDVTSGVLTSTLDENGDALAQPVTYDLDPIAVKTRLGNNSVWSDAGAVSVTYRADPNMVIYHSTAGGLTSWKMLQDMVRLGRAKEVLSVGDQLVCRRNGVDLVWDVLGIDCDTPADSQFTHSVTLGLHDCLAGLQFDAREALFYFEEGLAAGTYNFTVKAHSWVSGDVNKTFQFTLTQAIPAKGQLVLDVAYNVTIANSTAKTYSSSTSTTEIETVTITEGSGGTSLGDVNNAISGDTNSLQRGLIGNNRYSQSAMRQYLNSRAAAGSVWTPKNVWDRAPSWATTTAGFLNGMDEDFLAVIGEVTKRTALNTVSDGGGYEDTIEKFFPLSRSEVYGGNEVTGGEGAAYPYYSDYSNLGSAGTGNDSNRIKYKYGNGSAQYWWLRSPYAGNASYVRIVHATGGIDNYSANTGHCAAPACCIV